MKSIKILGTGCDKCETLAARAREAAENLGQDFEIEKVSKVAEIMAYGVMLTPALVVDGEVKAVGKVPSVAEIMGMLT
ncbi:TM0996/MTH895 family glutaredoxin-like protein [bacterium]|nr:TM0996/MTH895 family glutaredoxin-like protein [bacterium]MBU1073575.1 TM0996/MTH895 family glutaredoxin-like protein [bacterium]MBU1674573.1 TM0996/MTH895 family glutaredoxin-like protein [bacterium]